MKDVNVVLAEIQRIMTEELKRVQPVQPSDALMGDLELDSMSILTLYIGLEDHFRIKLREEEAAQLVTVHDLAELVTRRIRGET